ncbi:hypothetical protein H0H87_010293 [Tephrocybe sp. NHM501043]|nr:hypothetical protein H0H87_010293 [Tephrocybe sp. NHM501043]
MSHDWPNEIEHYGDIDGFLKGNTHLRGPVKARTLGAPPLMDLLKSLKPNWWFSAHMHTRFVASVSHEGSVNTMVEPIIPASAPPLVTKFLALDKCLPGRQFLEVLDIPCPEFDKEKTATLSTQPTISFDPAWLAITRAFHPYFSRAPTQDFPDEDLARTLVEDELKWVNEHVPKKLGGSWAVGNCQKFEKTALPISPWKSGRMKPGTPLRMYILWTPVSIVSEITLYHKAMWYENPQTVAFCDLLEIPNKVSPPVSATAGGTPST